MNCLRYILIAFVALIAIGCGEQSIDQAPLFEKISADLSGFDFRNDLTFDEKFNVYTYRNFYNGGGVAVGDINGDGLLDIYMTANMSSNKLYLNKGNLKFEDVTVAAGVGGTRAWSTGVTMADVNADGLLDIYVCNSGDIAGDNKQNELFINNGDLTFTEAAELYNLADRGFSTHASFFDYDKDGDLDAYILNNSYQSIAEFNLTRNERPNRDLLGGDKLMENVDGKFIDVSEKAGIYGSVIGFGLGVTVGDVNGDTWDDIFVSNDFFERDYLYINNQDGTFSEELTDQMKSICGASMGADMADMNNDGRNDLFVTEMLPNDYKRIKSVTTFEDWNKYQYNVKNGYYHQFTRNTFQVNNGDNTFHEVGRYAGIEATDWSWGALLFDMDRDGYRDLYVANGIYQDLTDQDYIQYISNEEVARSIISRDGVDYKKLIEIIPSNPISNFAYVNNGDLTFDDQTAELGLKEDGFSNGSVYADLDNDGDLDLIVNNVNGPSWLYKNQATEQGRGNYVQFNLNGSAKNPFGIGAKIKVTQGSESYYAEQQPIRGFQSSVDPRPFIGLKSDAPVDIQIMWPTGEVSLLPNQSVNQLIEVDIKDAKNLPVNNQSESSVLFTRSESLNHRHTESPYVDFNRDRLLYHMNSAMGPCMSYADLNGDGKEDVYIGGASGEAGAIYLSNTTGWIRANIPVFEENSKSEDTESLFFDLEGDGDLDLYVCSGSTEFASTSNNLNDRIYVNDGNLNFSKLEGLFPSKTSYLTSSTVAGADIDGDGDTDLFVGEHMKPGKYGAKTKGILLRNDNGELNDVTAEVASDLEAIGMVKDSKFSDVDGDGDQDLILVGEFMPITILENDGGQFKLSNPKSLNNTSGWWNRIHAVDLDGDGDEDYIIGNHGQNSRFEASESLPIALFLGDFDKNGMLDPLISKYQEDGKAYPYALMHNIIDQIKPWRKKFIKYHEFKNYSTEELIGDELMPSTDVVLAKELRSIALINQGNMKFDIQPLPTAAQMSPIYAISSGDYDKDGDQDILVGGNLYNTKPEVGRYDASYGTLLINDGTGKLSSVPGSGGFKVDGEIREILTLGDLVIVGRNNDSVVSFAF